MTSFHHGEEMIEINGNNLTIEHVIRVARMIEGVSISTEGIKAVERSHENILKIMKTGKPVYGINTGFGIFSDRVVSESDTAKLNRNLILSHSVGLGSDLPKDIVRAAMLIRANTLIKGYSGVRLAVIETLIGMLNMNITPIVPSQGSLGSSGDLGPLSHMALVFTRDEMDEECNSGLALFHDKRMSGKQAMKLAGIERLTLGPKEGLALNNGATFSTAIGAIVFDMAEYLTEAANASTALSLEALLGCSNAFDERIHASRGHPGQIQSSRHIRDLIKGSTFVDSTDRVQDAYSLRCAPQVHGAALDAINFGRSVIEREMNAATDNPLIFDEKSILSGGNFHGEPVGMALDFAGIAAAELGAISERRVYRLVDGKINNDLPPMLVDNDLSVGINSGVMMLQYTAASLVLENKVLAAPDTVHSLPTSAGQEDHNANSMNAAIHALRILENLTKILAIELFISTRALHLRMRINPKLQPGLGTKSIYNKVMSVVGYTPDDTIWSNQIKLLIEEINRKTINFLGY